MDYEVLYSNGLRSILFQWIMMYSIPMDYDGFYSNGL
jgi:hypothetical protein